MIVRLQTSRKASIDSNASRKDELQSLAIALRSIGEALPFVGGAIKAVAGLALSVIDASEV